MKKFVAEVDNVFSYEAPDCFWHPGSDLPQQTLGNEEVLFCQGNEVFIVV